jgi:hypothetical protein
VTGRVIAQHLLPAGALSNPVNSDILASSFMSVLIARATAATASGGGGGAGAGAGAGADGGFAMTALSLCGTRESACARYVVDTFLALASDIDASVGGAGAGASPLASLVRAKAEELRVLSQVTGARSGQRRPAGAHAFAKTLSRARPALLLFDAAVVAACADFVYEQVLFGKARTDHESAATQAHMSRVSSDIVRFMRTRAMPSLLPQSPESAASPAAAAARSGGWRVCHSRLRQILLRAMAEDDARYPRAAVARIPDDARVHASVCVALAALQFCASVHRARPADRGASAHAPHAQGQSKQQGARRRRKRRGRGKGDSQEGVPPSSSSAPTSTSSSSSALAHQPGDLASLCLSYIMTATTGLSVGGTSDAAATIVQRSGFLASLAPDQRFCRNAARDASGTSLPDVQRAATDALALAVVTGRSTPALLRVTCPDVGAVGAESRLATIAEFILEHSVRFATTV